MLHADNSKSSVIVDIRVMRFVNKLKLLRTSALSGFSVVYSIYGHTRYAICS